MAQVHKDRARKPLLEEGLASASFSAKDGRLMFVVSAEEPWQKGKRLDCYNIHLTEEEMFRVVSRWLEGHADYLKRRAARARSEAA